MAYTLGAAAAGLGRFWGSGVEEAGLTTKQSDSAHEEFAEMGGDLQVCDV